MSVFFIILFITLALLLAVYLTVRYVVPELRALIRRSIVQVSSPARREETIPEHTLRLLELEFTYAKESSLQAQKDRLTVVNFFLGLYAAVATGALGIQEIIIAEDVAAVIAPFAFFSLAGLAILFVLFLVRLRQAWLESIKVMNRVKDFFIERDMSVDAYILWRRDTIPSAEKFKTLHYLSALLIMFLGTAALVIAQLFVDFPLLFVYLTTLLYFLCSWSLYYFLLKYGW